MTNPASASRDKLFKVVRLHELELEHARVERAAADSELDRRRETAAGIQGEIDGAHDFARDLVAAATGVSPETLRHLRAYAGWQTQQLQQQKERVREAETLAGEARAVVMQRFQRLSALERLRERRQLGAVAEHARLNQKALDEHALVRVARDE